MTGLNSLHGMMEVDLVATGMSEEDNFQVCDDNDGSSFEVESCGICMDVVIDRGVLDCCQHWFCFACIDNWATITNLCPLCQNEFQLITCVPVYDTIGSSKIDEDSFSGDDDWCIEGKNNTLSFPSYYIDENSVICLDGDGCKVRNGSATIKEDSNLDTSIACDSCDMWYHAFCVGFDPENTSENTWFCPRCIVDKLPQKSDVTSIQRPNNQCGPENADSECLVEAAFSGKVSVSVADTGDTAVVVSMVGGNQSTEALSRNFLSAPEADKDQVETSISNSDVNNSKVETSSNNKPNQEAPRLELSLSCDTSLTLPINSKVLSEFKTNDADKAMNEQIDCDATKFGESTKSTLSESGSNIGSHLGLSVGSYMPVDNMEIDGTENLVAVGMLKGNPAESILSADKIVPDATEDVVGNTGLKRKPVACSDDVCTNAETRKNKVNIESVVSTKKRRVKEKTQMIPSMDQASETASDDLEKFTSPIVVSKYDKLRHHSEKEGLKENATSDIMSIVKGVDRMPFKKIPRSNAAEKSSEERENGAGLRVKKSSGEKDNAAGLRVKKIMRRVAEDKDSSMLVQKLRKEIREAVHNKPSEDFGKDLFDPKLLAAFRAAVAGPITEPAKKLTPLFVKAKKSMLQKGKTRESLTKKIYRSSNGRRRRAWDRDCEIEFWKHRCMTTPKPQKVETLKSVLDLLKKKSESLETEDLSELQTKNTILSRLYLADASVLPRKDDIKPLSALNDAGKAEQNKEHLTLTENAPKPSIDNRTVKILEKNSVPSIKGAAASSEVHPKKSLEGKSIGGSKGDTKKELATGSDIRSDKKKWALEVLARKTAVTAKNATHEKQEDNLALKGNYPLLAQLPADMRPVLATSRHNKIPLSVRQAQLYRLTEHFLRKANLPIIRRAAETELAVADAINIEKEVANRSNSKLVYTNLCSQELKRYSENNSTRATDSNPSSPSEPCTEREQATNEPSSDPVVEEALRNAGLLDDSPPNSPHNEMNDPPVKIEEEGPDNVLDIDSHEELDIYGDFEYNLEDEDFIGASTLKVPKVKLEEGGSRMRVVFSTLNSTNAPNIEDPMKVEVQGKTDKPCSPQEPLVNEGVEEVSLEECEELYGPDKEPKFLEKLYGVVGADTAAENSGSNQAVRASSCFENSPNHSQTGENVLKEGKKSDTEANKRVDSSNSVSKKVEAYIKEHIRPLCKTGVITAEQYRWAVGKATEKVMKYHSKDKNANFLIREGEKVKKLAQGYVEAAQQKPNK